MTEQDWYDLRDDRSNRLFSLKDIDHFRVGVRIRSDDIYRYETRIMTKVGLNILSRWCRNISVDISSTSDRSTSEQVNGFLVELRSLTERINPFGRFRFGEFKDETVDQTLKIGKSEPDDPDPTSVWIDADGWIAGNGSGTHSLIQYRKGPPNPTGAVFAACLGNAELFRRFVSDKLEAFSVYHSLFDLNSSLDRPQDLTNPNLETDRYLGTIYQIGCGAVGSSLDYILGLSDLRGYLVLIDFDSVTVPNCNSSLSFFASDAMNNRPKVDVCADALDQTRIKVDRFNMSYADLIRNDKIVRPEPDIVLCLANERNVWSDIQYNYPPISFHATTTPNWGLNLGRHIPGKEWCLMCRFKDQVKTEHKMVCSESTVPTYDDGTDPIQGVLPFLSTGSAVLVLAELIKVSNTGTVQPHNFVQFGFLNRTGRFLRSHRSMAPDCAFSLHDIRLYPDRAKRSIYWWLTGPGMTTGPDSTSIGFDKDQ